MTWKNSAAVLLALCLLAQTGCTADTLTAAGVALLAVSCAGLGALLQGREMWQQWRAVQQLGRRVCRLEADARRSMLGLVLVLLAAGVARADDPKGPDDPPLDAPQRPPAPPSEPGPAGGPLVHRSPQPPPSPCCARNDYDPLPRESTSPGLVDLAVDLAVRTRVRPPQICDRSPWPRVCGAVLPVALALGALAVLLVLALVAAGWRRKG